MNLIDRSACAPGQGVCGLLGNALGDPRNGPLTALKRPSAPPFERRFTESVLKRVCAWCRTATHDPKYH
jgi:hypothetical protein